MDRFRNILTRMTELMWLSLLWIIACLPIVSIGAACAAAYYAATKSLRHDRSTIAACFWYSFKQNLKQGISLTIVFAAISTLIAFYRNSFAFLEQETSPIGSVVFGALLITIVIIFASIFVWIFPRLSRFHNKTDAQITLAFFTAVRHIIRTLALCLWMALCVALIFLSIPFAFILPGLYFYISSFLIEPVLRKEALERQDPDSSDTWYQE